MCEKVITASFEGSDASLNLSILLVMSSEMRCLAVLHMFKLISVSS